MDLFVCCSGLLTPTISENYNFKQGYNGKKKASRVKFRRTVPVEE